ncbi:hypothetical protein AB0D32_25030 [Micromonospora sp. NPDC048170]|uniref:hypothetical protein n=1 Tax=Micromonospora sp. NPDC048170 TaxID=3154819 RepID=UPI0034065506
MYVVIVVCVLITAFNLFLLLGVTKRLRDQSKQLAHLMSNTPMPESMIAVGSRPDPFSARTVNGEHVTEAVFASGGLVGFFSPTCPACAEWLPRFVDAAAALPGGRGEVLAVVVAETSAEGADLVAELREVAMVVVERAGGPLVTSFQVKGYPSVGRFGTDGTLVSNEPPAALAVPAVT